MHEHADRFATCRSTSSGDSSPLATVIAFPTTPRRHRTPESESRPNRLSAWLFRFLEAAQCDGSFHAVLRPSITWADLIAAARTADPRIAIAAANPDIDAAVATASAVLTGIGARPRIDVELTLTPNLVTFALRGIHAEPVMTPKVADNVTATLQSSGSSEWTLQATDHGTLHWHLAGEN